jgi:hypothetical protein
MKTTLNTDLSSVLQVITSSKAGEREREREREKGRFSSFSLLQNYIFFGPFFPVEPKRFWIERYKSPQHKVGLRCSTVR